jgi:hypothetical protein
MGLTPLWLSFFLGLFAFVPFILNDVLFPASFMPDQFSYFAKVQQLRSFDLELVTNFKVEVSSWMLAAIPMPYAETIKSLGFFSRFMATILIIWLYAYKKLRGWPLLLILFYPSFLLYSSLALRDTLVFMFMIISVILFLENRRMLALLIASPLFIIKFQNFFLVIIFFIVHLFFSKGSLFRRYRYVFLAFILAALAPSIMIIIELLDYYRRALFFEDGGLVGSYVPIETIGEFVALAFKSAPYFFMKPLPWEASSFLQLIQSLENIVIAIFLYFIFFKASQVDKSIAIKWLVYTFISFSVYGLVVFNFGTAVRYKFPFILIVVTGIAYELYLRHGKYILNKRYRS